jgi:dTMP kinase
MENKKGVFIVFEGIDASGKSTQVRKFADYLFNRDKYNHVVLTRNPYKRTIIRAILSQDENPLSRAEDLTELFVEDRRQQVEELIIPSLERGYYVISDRYKLSTIAYQAAQGIDLQRLLEMNRGFPVPDLTYLIDVPSTVSIPRISLEKGRNEKKFEAHVDFLERVKQNYLRLSEILKDERIVIVNGNLTPDLVFEEVKRAFENL